MPFASVDCTISRDISNELASAMTSGMAVQEAKDVREAFKIKFEVESFPLSPPSMDKWVLRWGKNLANNKIILSQEKDWVSV